MGKSPPPNNMFEFKNLKEMWETIESDIVLKTSVLVVLGSIIILLTVLWFKLLLKPVSGRLSIQPVTSTKTDQPDQRKGNFSEGQQGGHITQNYFEGPVDRVLSIEDKERIAQFLASFNAKGVTIRFESSGETSDLAAQIADFLRPKGYEVKVNPFTQTGIPRKHFSLQRHPTDSTWAKIEIGLLN